MNNKSHEMNLSEGLLWLKLSAQKHSHFHLNTGKIPYKWFWHFHKIKLMFFHNTFEHIQN